MSSSKKLIPLTSLVWIENEDGEELIEDRLETEGKFVEDEDGEDGNLLEANEEWNEDVSQEYVADWQDGPSDPPRDQESISMGGVNRFIPPDDDNVYSMELRELLSR